MQVTKAFKNWIPNAFLLDWRADFEKWEESQLWESCMEECMMLSPSVQTLLQELTKRKRFKWGTVDLKCSQLQHKELKWQPCAALLHSPLCFVALQPRVLFFFIAHFSFTVSTGIVYRRTGENCYGNHPVKINQNEREKNEEKYKNPRQQLGFYTYSTQWKVLKFSYNEVEGQQKKSSTLKGIY